MKIYVYVYRIKIHVPNKTISNVTYNINKTKEEDPLYALTQLHQVRCWARKLASLVSIDTRTLSITLLQSKERYNDRKCAFSTGIHLTNLVKTGQAREDGITRISRNRAIQKIGTNKRSQLRLERYELELYIYISWSIALESDLSRNYFRVAWNLRLNLKLKRNGQRTKVEFNTI